MMLYVLVFAALLLSFGIVGYLTPKLLVLSLRKRLIDTPDKRKVHTVTASRLGGICFFPAIFLSVFLCSSFFVLYHKESFVGFPVKFVLEACALQILYIVGVADDVLGVRYRAKFVFQILAALLIVIPGTYIQNLYGLCGIHEIPNYIGMPLTIFVLIYVINAINLIDGIDGLASLLSIVVLAVYGTLSLNESMLNSLVAFATLGALLAFFFYNMFGVRRGKHMSKIFMGDTGALVIGLILGVRAIELWNVGLIPTADSTPYTYVLAYTMLIVPCFDVVRVVLGRFRTRKSLFLPDKSHIHHKLMELGVGQHQALLTIISLVLFFLLLNVLLAPCLGLTFIVLVDVACMCAYVGVLKWLKSRKA